MPDLDPAAVEAADQAIAALHDRTDLHTRTIEEARKAARAAIAAYLDRSGLAEVVAELTSLRNRLTGELAEARASLEQTKQERDIERTSVEQLLVERAEAVARAEKAERDVDTLMRRAILAEAARHAR